MTVIGYWAVGLSASWPLPYAPNPDILRIWLVLLTGLATTAVLLLRRDSGSLSLPLRHSGRDRLRFARRQAR
jgi:MATE family multidrug resistance protein